MRNIKHVFATLAMAVVASTVCIAQSESDEDTPPNGIRLGYQSSNLVGSDDDFDADNLNSVYFGIFRHFKVIPMIHIETGLEYMMAGAQDSDDTQFKLHYLVLPVQGMVKIGPAFGLVGINGNFKIGEKLTFAGEEIELDDEDKAPFLDVAVDIGAGFKFWRLSAEARYYWGLTEVYDDLHNRYAQFGLKFHF